MVAPHGSICVELGDTYSSGGAGGDYSDDGLRAGQNAFTGSSRRSTDGWPADKSLCLIPELYRIALVYGFNPLTGRTTPRWRVRNVIRWCLDGDTVVYARTPKGVGPVRLLHLTQNWQPDQWELWDGERWTKVLGWSSTTADDAIEITFRNGERISATSEHQWPTGRGVLRTKDLRVGDVVPTVRLPEPDRAEPEALGGDIGWFVGTFLADGSFDSRGRIQISGHRDESALRLARLERLAHAYDGTCTAHDIGQGNEAVVVVRSTVLAAVLHRYVDGDGARNKHLSPACWRRGNDFLRSVLAGYLDGDGHYDAKNDRWRLGFTDNIWLARDLRVLCARIGAMCRVRRLPRVADPRGGRFAGTAPFYHRGEIRFDPGPMVKPAGEVVAIKASKRHRFFDIGVEGDPHLFALGSGLLTHNCRPNPPVGALCVDDQTEALTPDGWKRHNELSDGDLIAAYDSTTDSCRFLPAKFVRWDRENEPMVAIEKRKTSQRLTEDHRCLVRTRKRPIPHVVLARDLTNSHQTLLAAPFDDVGGVEPMSDARAELLGWYVAEGSSKYRQALIRQSLTTNPAKVDRIRTLLVDEGADFSESVYRRSSGVYGGDLLMTFTVKGEIASWLNLHHKRLPQQYAAAWPTTTLRALFRGLIDGDGHRRQDGGFLFFQKERPVVDSLQIIALRLGMRCTVTRQDAMDGWQATIGDPEAFESSRWTSVRKWDGEGIPHQSYTGVVWCPMVETSFWLARRNGRTFITGNSDKFRPATSDMVIACGTDESGRRRYFDLDAVREPAKYGVVDQSRPAETTQYQAPGQPERRTRTSTEEGRLNSNPAGAPPLDWWEPLDVEQEMWDQFDRELWEIPTHGYKGSHYATFPPALCIRPIKAMCPLKVCTVCGEPSRRITSEPEYIQSRNGGAPAVLDNREGTRVQPGVNQFATPGCGDSSVTRQTETVGWSDCGHGSWRTGRVLDPFAGSGTTGLVATGHGRDFVGIDLDRRNVDLARDRIGAMFLEEVTADELMGFLGFGEGRVA